MKEETIFEMRSGKMKIIDNQIIIDTRFTNSKSLDYLLDLGSAKSFVFLDSNYFNLISDQKPVLGYGKTTSADGISQRIKYYQFGDISTDWFTLKNGFLSTLTRSHLDACNKIYGIWGSDLFRTSVSGKNNKILLINFQDSTLSILDTLPLLTNWILPENNYNRRFSWHSIKMRIGAQEYYFVLDTGFSGSILLSPSDYKKLVHQPGSDIKEAVFYGYISNTLSGTKQDTARLIRYNVQINDELAADSVHILSLNNINLNLIGMDFIKRFNVLVDYQNYQLYLQPNPNFQKNVDNFFLKKGMKPNNSIADGFRIMNLYVNSIAEKAGLKIGDEIISINNIRIDEGDPCEIERIYSRLDGNKVDNEIIVKRGEEILKFIL
ncbi:MAG: hypothetical protein IPN08_01575 [Bacteroidales bacterium]|nr:hypothetical protein [Bacteroidales bacterium]